MKPTPKTLALLVLAVVLAAFNLVGRGAGEVETLPELPAAPPDSVHRIEVSTPVQKLTLERVSRERGIPDFERWRIVQPLEFPADAAQIRSLLRTFGQGVAMEAKVDEGNLDQYGLDNENGLVVELFGNDPVPVVSFVVGKPAAGGSTFVRLPEDDAVYRADVGGRARWERPAADWRDKVALQFDRAQATTFTIQRGGETLRFARGASIATDKEGKPLPGPWAMDGAPFPIDDETVESVVRALSHLRAGDIHNPDYDAGFDAPAATATVALADGTTHTVVVGSRDVEGATFVKVDDRPEVFRTNAQVGRMLTSPLTAYRDRSLLTFERDDVETVSFTEGGITVVLAQEGEGNVWTVAQPPNMDADQKQAQAMINTLANLRAAGLAGDDRFEPTGARFVVRYRDGRADTLEIGPTERDADDRPVVRVRVSGRDGVWHLKEATLTELKRAFGRA